MVGVGRCAFSLTSGADPPFVPIADTHRGRGRRRLRVHGRVQPPQARAARGQLRCIGATTIAEYRKHIEKDKALEQRFQQVYVGEPSPEDIVSILRGLKPRYELHHGVRIRDEALLAAEKLSSRYLLDRFLPDKGELFFGREMAMVGLFVALPLR